MDINNQSIKFRILKHLIFWLLLISLQLTQINYAEITFNAISIYFGFFLLLIIVSYLNIFFIIPKFFYQGKYLLFGASLVVLTIAVSFLFSIIFINFESEVSPLELILFFIAFLVIQLFVTGMKVLSNYYIREKQFRQIENEQLKTELNLLKSQVNPHFLFNTLNNLYGLITQNQNAQASEITLKLGDLMRYLLESSKMERVSLDKEICFMDGYLALEKIRLSHGADIQFEVSGINRKIFIAPLLFIPLVENAFKHGISTISSDSFAHFSLSVQGSEIYFEAINSVGKPPENSEISGTGLENLKKRLQLIYPGRHKLDVEQTTNQFKAILHFQI